MKNFTNNFKQFTSRLSARWLIIALMMLVGTSGAWALDVLYLKTNGTNYWNKDNARFAAYFFGNGEKWVSMTAVSGETNLYKVDVPSGFPKVIFCRMNPSASVNNWNNKYNQTGDLTIPTNGNNLFTLPSNSWDGATETWSTYTPPCNVTLSVSQSPDANIYLTSESVTLSATAENHTSITWKNGDTTLGTGDSYTYTQSEVSNVTIKAIAANTTCNTEQTIDLAFVNQKAIKITTNGNYYLYTWDGDNTEYTSSWPGIKGTQEGDFYVWTIETTKPINAILNKGKDQAQSANIESLQVGYEYYLEWNGTGNTSVSTDNKTELPKPCITVEASHYTISQTGYTYDGNAKKPTVTANTADAGDPTSIEYKQGNTTVANPINVGEYDVYVTSNDGATYCGASNLKVGSFEIKCTKDITKDKFSYTLPTDAIYTGNPHAVSVNWESGTTQTNGAITVYYKKGEGVYENQAPTLEGTYTVAAKVTTAGNYCESDYIELGQFEISLAEQEDFDNTTSTSVCGATTTLSATGGSGEGDITYTIGSTNTANASIVNSTTLMATNSGSVEITATKAGEEGKYKPISSTKTITFTIPEAPFNGVAQSTTICAGSTFNYDADYIWYTSESGSTKVSAPATLNETTEYYISQEINGCESARTKYTVNVDQPLVAPTLTLTNPTRCNGEVTPGSIVIDNYSNYDNSISFKLYKGDSPIEIPYENGYAISEEGLYKVEMVTTNSNVCGQIVYSDIKVVSIANNTPAITDVTISGDAEVCINTGTTLTASVTAENYDDIAYLWSNGATAQSIQTDDLAEDKTFTVTVTATKNGTCPVTDVKDFNIQVKPISEPTIQATAISGINSIELSIKVQNAGCAENYTLGYRIKQFNDAEFGANQVIANATSENKVTTQIEGLVTGVEYIIEAYIVNGYNNNELFYAEPITCTVLASEDCDNPSADYIEILGPNDPDMKLYAFCEKTGSTPLGAWPGRTRDTWYEINSTGYSVWKIQSSEPVFIIFNKDSKQSADMKGPDSEGHKTGYRYTYSVNSNLAATFERQTIISDPEVQTISATPVRLPNGNSNVTIQGRVLKKGCAEIQGYGFQYKLIDADDYETVNVAKADIAVGEIFEKTIELPVGTYFIRARVVNENGSKAYGDEFRITIAERDLTIAAVHEDTDVDTETYYDFVGLYMSSITKPTNVEISSYTWYKDGNVYNPTITESSEYGATYINSNGSNNIRPNQIGIYKLKVQLSNGDIFESNEIEVSKASKVNASSILNASNRTLPVISVRTHKDFPTSNNTSYPSAQADDLKKKRSVDVKIFDKSGKLYYDRKARMNYRGSSSLNFVKKSYAFCPGDEMCGDVEKGLDYVITKKVNMFNLGAEDKDWVLYAAAADPSMMRNRIVFDTYSKMTNKWGVKSMYVELVVDGEYKGVYVFMDKITKNENRVNITAADGFIVKFDKTDTADRYVDGKQDDSDEKTFMTERTGRQDISTYGTTIDQMFEIEYPEKDDNKTTWNNIVASIKEKFEAFETALAEGKYAKVREIIDYDSWADWFIINEYIKNQDAYRASCIFVYNGEKIEARPLWDQELSMNNTCRTSNGSSSTDGLLIENDDIYTDCFPAPFWFTGRNAEFGSCGGDNGKSTIGTAYTNYLLKDGCFIGLVQQKLAKYLEENAALDCSGKINTDDTIENAGTLLSLAVKFNDELTATKEGATTYKSAQAREAKFWDEKSRSKADGNNGDTGYTDKDYSTEYKNVTGWITGDRDEKLISIVGGMSGEMSAGISITTSPANAIVTPWIPITVTVNVSDNAEYIYDDSAITEGIIVDVDKAITSKSGNVYKYTFPRPSDWGTNNVDTPIQQIVYPINAKLKVYDTVCPGLSNEAGVYIKLKDEGNDICGELVEQ